MKECPKCGAVAQDSEHFCSSCGNSFPDLPVSASAPNGTQSNGLFGDYVPATAKTKAEFMALPENAALYNACRTSAIFCYICGAITLVLMCFVFGNWFSLIDVAVVVGLGLGIHIKQSRVCAIILLVYAVINTIYMTATVGRPSGWIILIAGIFAVIRTSQAESAWKRYQQNLQPSGQAGQIPYQQPYQAQQPSQAQQPYQVQQPVDPQQPQDPRTNG